MAATSRTVKEFIVKANRTKQRLIDLEKSVKTLELKRKIELDKYREYKRLEESLLCSESEYKSSTSVEKSKLDQELVKKKKLESKLTASRRQLVQSEKELKNSEREFSRLEVEFENEYEMHMSLEKDAEELEDELKAAINVQARYEKQAKKLGESIEKRKIQIERLDTEALAMKSIVTSSFNQSGALVGQQGE